jgi:hypothetical protein
MAENASNNTRPTDEQIIAAVRQLGYDHTKHGFMDVCQGIYEKKMNELGKPTYTFLNSDEIWKLSWDDPPAGQACFFLRQFSGRVCYDTVHSGERDNTVAVIDGVRVNMHHLNDFLGMQVARRDYARIHGSPCPY